MDIDPVGAGAEWIKYMIGGFSGAFVSSSLNQNLLGQIPFLATGGVVLLVLVVVSQKIDSDNQEEMLEDTVRQSVEETVPMAVQESIQEELQTVDQQNDD